MMKEVASLRYGTIFKKAFSHPEIFTAFVKDVASSISKSNLGIELEIDSVETEKSFTFAIGRVTARFDLFAQDNKNRIIVDIQHARHADHYDRFLHYHCMAILEQIVNSYDYKPKLQVYTVVVLTGPDRHRKDVLLSDFQPRDLDGNLVDETPHKIIYLNAKYVSDKTPEPLREWLLAIADSLDEQVDESHYQRAEIRQVFELIKKDTISPEERAMMIEEYHREEAKRTAFEQGIEKGREEGVREKTYEIARGMLASQMADELILQLTGLSKEELERLRA